MNKVELLLLSIFFSIVLCSCSATKPISNQQIVVNKKDTTVVIKQQPSILSDSVFNNAHIGICVYEPATNTYLYNYQSNKYFIPASNTKIATCYAAMKYLGDSLVGLIYDTLNFHGKDDSTITIFGVSDPTFLHSDFKNQRVFNFLTGIKNRKIFLGEITHYPTKSLASYGKGWARDDYNEAYMAERSFFPIYGNVAKFYLDDTVVKVIPGYFQKKVVQSKEKLSSFKIERLENENSFMVYDNPSNKKNVTVDVPLKLGVDLVVNNFNHVEGNLLADTLKKKIAPSRHRFTDKSYLFSKKKIYSQPTDSLLKPMMHNSDNFFAEQTLLMVSLNQLGYLSDEKIIDSLLKTDFKSLPQKPRWVDGSGLSRYNLFSPQDFVFILNKMKNEFSWQRISTIFPTGDEGTLKGYYKGYQNKIFAKTGSLSNNYSLSGFIKSNAGKAYIFSIMVNNHQVTATEIRTSIEKFITTIIENN